MYFPIFQPQLILSLYLHFKESQPKISDDIKTDLITHGL